jgi:hypothetical protein
MADPEGVVSGRPPETDFTRTYVLVVIVEILVVAGLYWFGRHFS